jgi:hypothetical protein
MNVGIQRRELASLNNVDRGEFAGPLVTLIKNNREVGRAIMGLALASPYIVRQY